MSKIILAIIVLVIIIVVLLGAYLLFGGSINNLSGNQTGNNNQNANMTDIQGMKVQTTQEGSGVEAKNGDKITVNYVGTLADGTKFDSSIDRNSPFSFILGQGRVIRGWDLGVLGMKVGEKRTLIVPPDLAYGENGFPPIIPKSATLTFQVELLQIN